MKKINDIVKYVGNKAKATYEVLKPDSFADVVISSGASWIPLSFYVIERTDEGMHQHPAIEFIEAALPFAATYIIKKSYEHRKKKSKQ